MTSSLNLAAVTGRPHEEILKCIDAAKYWPKLAYMQYFNQHGYWDLVSKFDAYESELTIYPEFFVETYYLDDHWDRQRILYMTNAAEDIITATVCNGWMSNYAIHLIQQTYTTLFRYAVSHENELSGRWGFQTSLRTQEVLEVLAAKVDAAVITHKDNCSWFERAVDWVESTIWGK